MKLFRTLAMGAMALLAGHALAQGKTNLSISTGGTGGVYYPLGGGMASILTKFVPKVIPVTAGNGTLAVGDLLEWVSTATLTGAPDVGGKVIVQHSLGT